MPNLLGNPHSISVQGLCTMLIAGIHSPVDAHCNPSPPTFLLEAAFYSKRLAHSHHLPSSPPHLF